MRKLLAIIVLSLITSTGLASLQNPIDVIEVKQSLDATFFENCLSNLTSYEQNTIACVAFKMPSDRVFFSDGGLVGSFNYLAHWSEVTPACRQKFSRLYIKSNSNGDILFVSEAKECLQAMADAHARLGYPWTDKSIYLKKK